jgi:L-threonylcarbamoyladenylate synthase
VKQIDKAVEVLKKGGVVVYPTDTAYGLAVDATNLAAVKKLYRLKGRDFKKPIHVIVPDRASLIQIASLDPQATKLIKKFWPGPLTLVLPLKAKGTSWQILSTGTKTIGVRYPDHPTALGLVKTFGKPTTTTSANISSQPNTYSITEIKKQFAKSRLKPDFYLDGGRLRITKPSTVVSLANKHVKILRQGPITEKQIKNVLFPQNQHRS